MKKDHATYLSRPTILFIQVALTLMLPMLAIGPAISRNGAIAFTLYGVAAFLFLAQLTLVILSLLIDWNKTVILDKTGITMRGKNKRVTMLWGSLKAKDVSAKYGKIRKIKFEDDENSIVLESDWRLLHLIEEYCSNKALVEALKRIVMGDSF
ncbi:MAG: hypothetical protein J6328_00790 [Bacilli bacterium]|nr:hypothetical protein [Bacilli bacterium]